MDLIELWKIKTKLSQGHPFRCDSDIKDMALDAIWDVAFGRKIGTLPMQVQQLQALSTLDLPKNRDSEARFPAAKHPADFDALQYLVETMGVRMAASIG